MLLLSSSFFHCCCWFLCCRLTFFSLSYYWLPLPLLKQQLKEVVYDPLCFFWLFLLRLRLLQLLLSFRQLLIFSSGWQFFAGKSRQKVKNKFCFQQPLNAENRERERERERERNAKSNAKRLSRSSRRFIINSSGHLICTAVFQCIVCTVTSADFLNLSFSLSLRVCLRSKADD